MLRIIGLSILGWAAAVLIPQWANASLARDVNIENDLYKVVFHASLGDFSILHKLSGKTFATNGTFESGGGRAAKITVNDKTFGRGQGIEIVYPSGRRDTLELYAGLPFVLFKSYLLNGSDDPVTLNTVPVVSMAVDTGRPLSDVRTLGTGGLLAPGQNPGSYAFLAIVDPASRGGAVGGWITHDRGSGVVFSPVRNGAVRIQAQIDYGRLRINPGADAVTETFALGWFGDARFGLEAYADAIAKMYAVRLPRQMAGFCTWYLEKHAAACDEVHLPQVTAVAAKELKPFGFDFIQIDDEWQAGLKNNGPKKNFTTHAPGGPYRNGMKAAADNIKKAGLVPGIWFMPFAGNYKDPFFKDHQDWFAKDAEGNPYETAWGGTCLDMTKPETQAYVSSVVQRISHDWGYRFFKMDGFWTGSATRQVYVNDGYKEDGIGDARFVNPDKTNIEALRDGTRLVRDAAGSGVFLLGCCVSQNMRSFGGSFGLLDAMRIGPDTGGDIGAPHGSRLWFLNGRVWWNDPDCVFVRSSLTIDRARLNASWTAIAGHLFYVSDWLPETPTERLDIIKRCIPAHGLPSRPVDVFESPVAQVWLLSDTRGSSRRDVVALYNWDNEQSRISVATERIGLPPAQTYVAFDFWANAFVPPFQESITALLPAYSCRILAVRPADDVPQLLSTSRHVTQGIVDVTGEQWDTGKSTLSAVSTVIADDPYELRIVVPTGEKSWRVKGVSVSAEDLIAGVKATFKQDGPEIRATLTSPVSREVKWMVQFERGPVSAATPPALARDLAEYFQPTPVTGKLTTNTWGDACTLPRDVTNGLEDPANKWLYWDSAIIKAKDGKYHMFASRWPESLGHDGWSKAVIIHAVSDTTTGPYIDKGLAFTDHDGVGCNVAAVVLPDGRYALLLSETRPGSVYISSSLDGPWEYQGDVKIDDNGFKTSWMRSNMALMVRPDGSFLSVARRGFIMLSTNGIMGPYKVQGQSIWPTIEGLNNEHAEDPVIWYSGGLYHITVNWWSARKAYHLASPDGITNWTNMGLAYDPKTDFIRYTDGTVNHWNKIERPAVVIENGHVTHFTFAVLDVEKGEEKGNDNHGSKVIVIPFDGKSFDADMAIIRKFDNM